MALFNRRRRWLWVLGALALLLIVGRLVAPPIIAKVVRNSLDDMKGGYHGDIRDVELSVFGAEVAMLDLTIAKTNGLVPVPFMHIPRFVLAVSFKNFRPYTELIGVGAEVNLVDAEEKAKQQWGPKFDLRDLREQLPFELRAVRFEDGSFHFRNYEAKPQVDLAVKKLNAAWEDLQSCLPPGSKTCDSKLTGKAQALRGGSLALRGSFDRNSGPNFFGSARLDDIKPVQLNAMLLEYAKIDVQEGTIDLSVQYRNQGDNAQRLVLVPRLYDVKVVGSANKGEVKLWREMLAGAAAGYFERKRGTKAIAYKRHGAKGEWSIIDWDPGRLSTR
jgi:hypothetical protein